MPLQLPVLDDRSFEQLLDEARSRIPAYTPEWTNFGLESDPGITLIQLFAFLTDSLLYRANRIPERNRIKFLQLLGIPLQPAAAAEGIVAIRNGRGPLKALPLNAGVALAAGNVSFVTRDPLNVLPLEAQVCYKLKILEKDPRYERYKANYEAVVAAQQAELEAASSTSASSDTSANTVVTPAFYETMPMPAPTAGNPNPVLDLATDTLDRAVYIALLAPKGVDNLDDVRNEIANKTLSIGLVPEIAGDLPPLKALRPSSPPATQTDLVFERCDVQKDKLEARYLRLPTLASPNLLASTSVVPVQLPDKDGLGAWSFSDPMQEGTGSFPPRIEDEEIQKRLVTWIRLRLPDVDPKAPAGTTSARLTWVGINAARVVQAVDVFSELLGTGSGEPDQVVTLSNTPVIANSVTLTVQDGSGVDQTWRMTDDLLSAEVADQVFTLDPESGQIHFGDGLHGARPPAGRRILASYRYGGGPQGMVGIGAIKSSSDPRLQGGYKIESPVPTYGGHLGVSVAEAERNIPLFLRHRDRLVTLEDFKDVTKGTPGVDVGRVEVLPQFLPSSPPDLAPGVVTVVVIPKFDALHPLWPVPDRPFLQKVCDYLDPRRLVTTEIYVRGPEYVLVYVSVGIQVRGGFFSDLVRNAAKEQLNSYLSSLPPGGPDGTGWPLNKRLLKKDLEAVITRVPGVEFVDSIEMGVENTTDVPDYGFSGLKLPQVGGLNVIEGTAEPLSSVFDSSAADSQPGIQVLPVPVAKCKC